MLQKKYTRGCTQGSSVTRAWPTKCCCEHTHMCLSEKTQFIQGCTQGSKAVWIARRTAAVSIHMCVWQNHVNSRLAPRIKYKSLADQLLLRAYTYVCVRNSQFQVAPNDHRLHWTGRSTARICQVKVAPKGQGIQVFGRPRAAVSIHMCVAK